VFIISASAQIAPFAKTPASTWTKERGLNCYTGRGATGIDKDPIGTLSLKACQAKCKEMAACTGITVETSSENKKGNCWRRKDINLAQCDRTFGEFDTWIRSPMPLPPSPSTGAYDEEKARMFAALSSISYCKDMTHVFDWTCKACSLSGMPLAPRKIRVLDAGVQNATRILIGKLRDRAGCLMAFRGSYTDFNWRRDEQMRLVTPTGYADCKNCKVHYGFYTIWENVREQALQALRDVGCGESMTADNLLYVTGHSMGAALTELAAFNLQSQGFSIAKTYVFEAPRVGNKGFADAFALKFGNSTDYLFHTTHAQDPYVHLPPEALGYKHVQTEVFYDRNAAVKVCPESEDRSCSDRYWDIPLMLKDHTDDHCSMPFMAFNICAPNELGLCAHESSDVIV